MEASGMSDPCADLSVTRWGRAAAGLGSSFLHSSPQSLGRQQALKVKRERDSGLFPKESGKS